MICLFCNQNHNDRNRKWCDKSDLEQQIEAYQRLPYIILKHEGKYYKCYEIVEIEDQLDKSKTEQAYYHPISEF